MASLDDQFYQLFSGLLKNAKDCDGLSFDGSILTTGHGPLYSLSGTDADLSIYLGKRANLLGFAHPLTYKSRLKSSLSPFTYTTHKEEKELLKRVALLVKKFTNKDFFIGLDLTKGEVSYDAGRHLTLLSQEQIAKVESGQKIIIPNLLPFSFSVSSQPKHCPPSSFITMAQYEEAISLLKLLELGDFYGMNGHISRLSNLLKSEFSELSHVISIEGLLIHLEKDRNYSFLDEDENIAYMPLFFDSSFMKTLRNHLAD